MAHYPNCGCMFHSISVLWPIIHFSPDISRLPWLRGEGRSHPDPDVELNVDWFSNGKSKRETMVAMVVTLKLLGISCRFSTPILGHRDAWVWMVWYL